MPQDESLSDTGTPTGRRLVPVQTASWLWSSRFLILVFLFAAALAVRLYHIDEPPLNFHATREYRSLIIARGFYFASNPSLPAWEKQVASFSQSKQGILEPPILEFIVSIGYRLLAGEHYWLPRLLSSLFWLIGGAFLYLVGRQIADASTAMFATAYYLFLPFAVVASRSFQPDPLMVMLMLFSVWATLRYHDEPSGFRLTIAALVSALAFLIKPGAVFVIISAFLALQILKQGVRRAIASRASWLFIAITMTPTLFVYGYGILKGSFLINEGEKTLLPQLLLSLFFWRGWVTNIGSTIGLVAFFAGLMGLLLFREGVPRVLMLALWIGYAVFGLTFNYNFAVHDYYQLQLVPIVGLSMATIIALVVKQITRIHSEWYWRAAVWGILLGALLLSVMLTRPTLINADAERTVRVEQEIGELVHHSTRTIFLSGDYGVPLEYNGLLSGYPWPLASDLEWEQLAGRPAMDAQQLFQASFAGNSPEYFIIQDMVEYGQQPDLQEFLNSHFSVVAETSDYLIFSLKGK